MLRMKTFTFLFLGLSLLPAGLSFAQGKSSLTVEFDNRSGVWNPRLMLMANPVSNFMVDLRKGIGGSHLQALLGWDFPVGKSFIISPYAGVGLADSEDLRPIYLQTEVITFAKTGAFRNVFIASYSLSVDESTQDNIYFQEKAWFQLINITVGVLSDMVILPLGDDKIAFWRMGPQLGYVVSRTITFTVWPNWELQSETWGFRVGSCIRF